MRRAGRPIGGWSVVVAGAWSALMLGCPTGAEGEGASGVDLRRGAPKAEQADETAKAGPSAMGDDAAVGLGEELAPGGGGSGLAKESPGRVSATQAAGLDAPPSPIPLTMTPRKLGPLDRDTAAGRAELARRFPSCTIDQGTYDHLGRSSAYFEVLCGGVAVLGVLAAPGPEARIVAVRVLAREVTPPSGFGVGVRYAPLVELNPDVECRRATLPGAGDLFPEASTICAGRLAPNILYLFRGQTFRRGEPDPALETRRIDELLWLPQAAP